MNSLLQSLFMTPEFRSALYSWYCALSSSCFVRYSSFVSQAIRRETRWSEGRMHSSATTEVVRCSAAERTSLCRGFILFSYFYSRSKYICGKQTTGLTRSFRWSAEDSFRQHDVQELCRVLFDALERSLKAGNPEAHTVIELFQGLAFRLSYSLSRRSCLCSSSLWMQGKCWRRLSAAAVTLRSTEAMRSLTSLCRFSHPF